MQVRILSKINNNRNLFKGFSELGEGLLKKNIYHNKENQYFQFDKECLKEKSNYVSKQNHLTHSNPILENCR